MRTTAKMCMVLKKYNTSSLKLVISQVLISEVFKYTTKFDLLKNQFYPNPKDTVIKNNSIMLKFNCF